MALIISIFLSFFIGLSSVFAEEHALERIVVRQDHPSLEILTSSDIDKESPDNLAQVLDYVPGLDLRNRGPMGIQGDLSLSGSTYEQAAVLIDGIRVMDPQTGHHNLDIPLTVYDLEQVEINKTPSSGQYGAGALAGSMNIVTKKPQKKTFNLDGLFGEHALFGQGFSLSMPKETYSYRFSFDHKIAKAARPNTDFEYNTASVYFDKESGLNNYDLLCGYQKKDFGADSFYSNLFPEEEEHTETLFAKSGAHLRFDRALLKENIYLRRHRDKFILNRNNPTSVNYHTTYLYGLNSELALPVKYGDMLLGVDIGEDEINSTNLGKHSRSYQAGSLGFTGRLGQRLNVDTHLRLDSYQKWGEQGSYDLGMGYDLIQERLKLSASLAHAFRLPSFTELFYADSANIGNPDLKAEKSDTLSAGLDFKKDILALGINGFLRRGKNLIDWTRLTASGPWQATNLGRVDFQGIEFSAKVKTALNFKSFNLKNMDFSYNYLRADKKASGFLSKYALDILKHRYILDIYSVILGLDFNWQLSYQERYYGDKYFLGGIYIGKRFSGEKLIFEPFIKIDNFTDAKYSEVGGVLQPGRWIKSGFKLEW